jgi:hypothetical protein
MLEWSLPLQAQTTGPDLAQFIQETTLMTFNPFTTSFASAPLEYLPATTQAMDFSAMSPVDATAQAQGMQWGTGMANWQDFEAAMSFQPDGLPIPRMGSIGSNSPTGTYLEVLSLNSGSDNGWTTVDMFPNYESFPQSQPPNPAIFNPSQTLHLRTSSDSSQSDGTPLEFGSYEEVAFPPYSPFSPASDTYVDNSSNHRNCCTGEHHHHQSPSRELAFSPSAVAAPSQRPPSPSSGGPRPARRTEPQRRR